MKTLGNILWFFLSGLELAVMWFVAGLVCCATVIMIPVGVQCFKFAGFVIWPFGRTVVNNGGVGKALLNIIWIVFFGLWLAIVSAVIGLLWCVTVVGIPFGLQCFKFAGLALTPFGSEIVPA